MGDQLARITPQSVERARQNLKAMGADNALKLRAAGMKIVNGSGALQSSGFDWGCSHSGFERVAYDPTAKKFVSVCKNDAMTGSKSGRIAFAPNTTTIYPVDLSYSNLCHLP